MSLVTNFLSDLQSLGPYWGLWLKLLGFVNFVLPVLLIVHPLAKLTLLIFLLQAGFMLFLYSIYGFVPLLGLGHFGWFFLIYVLFKNLEFVNESSNALFFYWGYLLILVNSLSLVIDVYDVGRYFLQK